MSKMELQIRSANIKALFLLLFLGTKNGKITKKVVKKCRSRVKIIGGPPQAPKSRSFRESGGMLLREIFISWVSEIAFLAVIQCSVRNY